ncbi:MAG: RIO1 family regulatory kinase/ATPase [Dehalococcoidia bacterium]
MGKNKIHEQELALEEFAARGLIDDVIGVVKSGKEATVYACRAGDRLLAAKVYRSEQVRRFHNNAVYTQGRLGRRNRYARAIEQRSRAGREFAFSAWVSAEYETLSVLHRAGVGVPTPLAQSGPVILMEYIGDEDSPAPPLSSVRLDDQEAREVFERLMQDIELMLACDRVHGDLSPFNVLYDGERAVIIDFPQAVDPRSNHSALELLERDIDRICAYFERLGVAADARRLSRDLWGRFLRSEL